MDRETRRQVDEYRRAEAGPIENNLIDELVGGELDRQEFLRRASIFGLGAGTMGLLLRYIGEDVAFGAPTAVAQKRGGTLRVAATAVGSSFEPILLREAGTLALAGIVGEYLTFSNQQLRVQPWLAESWRPNGELTVWTFQLRRGVKFHNGKTMTADDVVASFKSYMAAPTSQLFSAIPKTLLGPEGVVKTGPYTVQFRLKSPNNAFPQLVSQTSYQAIIQPAAIARKPETWVGSGMIGTGAFRFKSGTPNRRVELVRFPAYWGGPAPLDRVVMTWYEGSAPQVLALRGGQVDLCVQLNAQEVAAFRKNKRFKVFEAATASHRMFGLRTDRDPFRDARVRRAIALTLNRPDIIRRILLGAGTLGNDSPFWSKFPSTDPSIKQRKQDLELARALLRAAGQENLKFTLTTWNGLDHPDHAQALQAAARQAGIDIELEVQSSAEYYGGGADYYATTPWINRPATLTEYGHRGVPNLYITAAYMSDGIWNASHYKNPGFDAAAKQYLGSVETSAQRKATKKMAGLLLRDTPVITDYFITYVTAGSAKVQNYRAEGISHVRVAKTSLA
ncbi:MAG TPA: ABC transporter substrate-binding protein [Gaiellaceae bacterium]|nr:ABC transporter substrate-binding protein [Gaiellaceae bacterium]